MIEAHTCLLELSSITVPPERQRAEISYERVLELATSIAQHGLLQEPGVQEEGIVLTWGAHRYKAFCLLHAVALGVSNDLTARYTQEQLSGLRLLLPDAKETYNQWATMPVKLIRGASSLLLRVMELAENLNREELPWQDKAAAVWAIHKQASTDTAERGGIWTDAMTARLLGITTRACTHYLTPQRKLEAIPDPKVRGQAEEAVKQSPSAISAAANVDRIASRHGLATNPREAIRQLLQKAPADSVSAAPPTHSPIICADFHEWAATYNGPKFNFIHCDFSYGVSIDAYARQRTCASTLMVGKYEDTEETYWQLLDTLLSHRDRLIEQSAHIMFWLSVGKSRNEKETMFDLTRRRFLAAWEDVCISPIPLIWHCSDNAGLLPTPQREPRRTYEWALHITLGDRKLAHAVAASFAYPRNSDVKIHQSQKHQAVLEHFFRLFVDSSTRMLDPTCGSGTSVVVAQSLGAAYALGLEINPDTVALAQKFFNKEVL